MDVLSFLQTHLYAEIRRRVLQKRQPRYPLCPVYTKMNNQKEKEKTTLDNVQCKLKN